MMRCSYILRAKITAAYDMSRAGAVMLKIATMVCVPDSLSSYSTEIV